MTMDVDIVSEKIHIVNFPEFYQFLPGEEFLKLFSSSLQIMVMFGSMYVCEQFVSTMKINVMCSKLTDEHFHSVLRLANLSDLKPNNFWLQKNVLQQILWGKIYLFCIFFTIGVLCVDYFMSFTDLVSVL